MALQAIYTFECRRDDGYVKMPLAVLCACVSCM